MRQSPGLEGSEGRCCVGTPGVRGWETPAQELLPHQAALGPRGLGLMSGLGEEPPMLILLMTVISSYFVTIEQNQSAKVNFGSSSL